MSLFMALHGTESVLVVTDTRATTTEGDPYLYVTKCRIVPHLDMVLAGTGIAQLPDLWHARVMDSMLCRDIDMLDRHAPAALRSLWREELGLTAPEQGRATIYHFGFSELRREYVGYAYRSTDDFASEALQPGFRVKPEADEMPDDIPGTLKEMVALARRIRADQDRRPAADRVYVGGELVLTALQNGGTTCAKIHRWEDFDIMWDRMNDRLRRESA
ncbi:MAG: hypothetical protein LC792_04720 [Actinobacteria bacterium]|nr:hypothetical protein [Actinomycetota bacterium]